MLTAIRKNPYAPIFNMTPANNIEPAVGAWTCASGSLGLPLMAGFVAEICILIAFWMSFGWLTVLPALTLIITAAYYLRSMQRTIFESGDEHKAILPDTMKGEEPRDLTWHENTGMIILGALAVVFGILPGIFLGMMSNWSSGLVAESFLAVLDALGVTP